MTQVSEDRQRLVAITEKHVEQALAKDATGHDWWHVQRVRTMALRLASDERADPLTVELGALLHDLEDAKFTGSTETAPAAAAAFLRDAGAPAPVIAAVADIVRIVSFHGSGVADAPGSLEARCVRDADRLDALGAIGIARAFAFGGSIGRPIHDPSVAPVQHADVTSYTIDRTTTINHFYEKLLLLKQRMHTRTAQRLAEERHAVLQRFLEDFFAEWDSLNVVLGHSHRAD